MSQCKPRLAFVSPLFLFPNDAGGKIRTTNILRGLKGGRFDVVLASPATAEQKRRWAPELEGVCDEFVCWSAPTPRPKWRRALDLLGSLPVNVAADKTDSGVGAVLELSRRKDVDLMVFDFVHAAVLAPNMMQMPTVCFTHNVESEIFARHAEQAIDPVRRWLWSSQQRKMVTFETSALQQFDEVIAVSERDASFFVSRYGVAHCSAIPTGVDLDFFAWRAPPTVDADHPPTVVFTGSMDWIPNIGGVKYFVRHVWPFVLERCPLARFVVVGRDPPEELRAACGSQVTFTGFVDDVRPFVHSAHAFVIPLLVGGGTRIKAFEAMAMGCPVVSTTIGAEGLDVQSERHFLQRDDPADMANAIVSLIEDPKLRADLSTQARARVEERCGHRQVAGVFEGICLQVLQAGRPVQSSPRTGGISA